MKNVQNEEGSTAQNFWSSATGNTSALAHALCPVWLYGGILPVCQLSEEQNAVYRGESLQVIPKGVQKKGTS